MTIDKPVTRQQASTQVAHQPASAHVAPLARQAGVRLSGMPWVRIAGCTVHLSDEATALRLVAAAAARPHPVPLAVSSVNLDHVHHFGGGRRYLGGSGVEWLHLADGAPIASEAERIAAVDVPRLAGSDLVGPILEDAARSGAVVAILGGSAELSAILRDRLSRRWPRLAYAGHWCPERAELTDPVASRRIARELREAGADIVIVCLGKPRQEEWIDSYGAATGAGVLLAFGAVVDFLAGRVSRAPRWISEAGIEWLWRLSREPGRLARRYLVEGPPAYIAVRRSHLPAKPKVVAW